jgi:hypothetical protein
MQVPVDVDLNLSYLFGRVYGTVPEHWGRDSPYHGGTEFLGTPQDHLQVRDSIDLQGSEYLLILLLKRNLC